LRTLFLHIGPSKTATSAIQSVLRNHDGSRVIYPRAGQWADGSHHNLVLNFFGDYERPDVRRENIDDLLAQIAAEAGDSSKDIVISSEMLLGRDIAAFAAALTSRLGAQSHETRVLAVAREHFGRTSSLYNQWVKDFAIREIRDPDEFLQQSAPRLAYGRVFSRLLQERLAVDVLNFHPAETLVARFLAALGFPPDTADRVANTNPSMSTKALIAILCINRLGLPPPRRRGAFSALRTMPGFLGPAEFSFGPDAVAAAEPIFAADRRFLARRFGIRLPDTECARRFSINESELAQIAAALGARPERHAVLKLARNYLARAV